jgi:long-subunit acyl-CoA synthetase (AMP-forming)
VFAGYHNNPEANKDAFDDQGWFKTGDVGVFMNGLFYIVDRKKVNRDCLSQKTLLTVSRN